MSIRSRPPVRTRRARGWWFLLALAASVLPAEATCPFSRRFTSSPSTYGSTSFVTPYLAGAVSPEALGFFWQLGVGDPALGSGADNGSWPAIESTGGADSGWLYMVEGYTGAWIGGNWEQDPRVDGCPYVSSTTCMAVLLGDRSIDGRAYFLFLTDRSPGYEDFEFVAPGVPVKPLVQVPRANVTAGRRVDGGWEYDLAPPSVPAEGLILDPSCSGAGVVGYRVYAWTHTFQDPYPPDSLAREAYVPLTPTIPIGQPATVFLADFCYEAVLVNTLVFSDGFETPYVAHVLTTRGFLWVDWDCDGSPGYFIDPQFPLDCDDADPTIHPDAPQACDGVNNDCFHPSWPDLAGTNEADDDLDGWTECAGDCDDAAMAVFPGAEESCNAADDDCDGLVDEGTLGEDTDADRVHDLCDNCPASFNEGQTNRDADSSGDVCDLDDGFIHLAFAGPVHLAWQHETGDDAWNLYRGDLLVLRTSGVYSQLPGTNPLAAHTCGLAVPEHDDADQPPPGSTAFYLVSGIAGGVEGGLGPDGDGQNRPNHHPCP